MDPFTIAAIIAGGGSVLSSIFGGLSEHENAQANNAINEKNFELQKEAYEDSKLGAIDANGNRTHFIDGVGWVTTYGPTDQAIADFYAGHQVPQSEAQFLRSAQDSRDNNRVANGLLREFEAQQRLDPAEYERMLFSAASRGVNENTKNALEVAMRGALRSGSSNSGAIANKIAEAGNKALADAAVNSKLQALDYVNGQYATNRSNTANLYNAFLSNARQGLNPPTSLLTPTSQQVQGQTAPTPQQAPQTADNGLANALGGIGAGIGGIFNNIGAQKQTNTINNALLSYLSGGGSNNIFGNTDRSARSGGTF